MKIISEHDFKITTLCKKDDNMKELINYLKEYLLLEDISDPIIYHHLTTTVINVLNKEQLQNFYIYDLHGLYIDSLSRGNDVKCCYKDLINLLRKQLLLLKMKNNNEDLYAIDVNGKIYSYHDYFQYQKEKNNEKKLTKK